MAQAADFTDKDYGRESHEKVVVAIQVGDDYGELVFFCIYRDNHVDFVSGSVFVMNCIY